MAYRMSSLLCRTLAQRLAGAKLATVPKTFFGRLQCVRHLPVCTVQTNLEATQIPQDFLSGLSKVISDSLKKPEEGIWYTPPVPGNRRIAGGKLTEKLRNTCRLLNNFEPAAETLHEVCLDDSVSEDNVRDDLNWLKYNCQPWVTVLDKWQKTSSYRTNHLQSGTKKLSDFKMYSDPKADSLLNTDFKTVCRKRGYPECSDRMFNMWPEVALKLIDRSNKKHDANDSDDVKALKAMVCSTCSKRSIRLATSQDATKKKRKTWCPSGEDCLQSFLVFAQDLDEAELILIGLRSRYVQMDLKVNPLVFSLPNSTIVAFDSTRLLADSLIKGVDMCFKLITVISISLSTGVAMVRGGTSSGTATVEIWSIGVFDAERNPKYSEEFIPFLAKQLNLPSDRIALFFHPLNPEEAGHILYRNSPKRQTKSS